MEKLFLIGGRTEDVEIVARLRIDFQINHFISYKTLLQWDQLSGLICCYSTSSSPEGETSKKVTFWNLTPCPT